MLKQFEEEIIREYRDRFSLAGWDDIEVLAYARHHGAPTRLLDWSRNPLIGLWFAVADKANDASDGTVFQLNLLEKTPDVCPYFRHLTLEHADNCQANRYVHVFLSPRRAGRTERQQSVFSIASFKNDYVLCPLDQTGASLSKFSVPAARKAELRYMLADLGLDAYSVYGDVDSFGEYVSLHFDVLNRPRRDKPADEIR
jgi:type I restriction enzyme M protein